MGKLGIIGGSGLYDMDEILDQKAINIDTPFGQTSDDLITGRLFDIDVVFLARHGRGHRLLPSEINYKANIYAFKKMDVNQIISVSAVGSLQEQYAPMHIVLPDQFVDRTNRRKDYTFFGQGIVAHIAFADPICPNLRKILWTACNDLSLIVHDKGVYLNMEGPAFSTRAESNLYRQWGMDVIGMTNLVEAKLAREAEICYATLAMVTDYDCWKEEEEAVNADMVFEWLMKNAENAKNIIKNICQHSLKSNVQCNCENALAKAILTNKDNIPQSQQDTILLLR